LEGCGAYFAYLKHPFDMASDALAQDLVKQAGVLTLPGTMFMPDNGGQQHLRIAFANVDRAGITALFDRLVAYQP
jgi:aspartate/methionine/tyrosine aminotransferase